MARPRRIHTEVLPEIDVAARSERPDQLTCLGIERVGPVPHEMENPLAFGALPIGNAAIAQPDDLAVVVLRGVEGPELAPVAASIAIAFRLGVLMYITPLTTIGFACMVDRWVASPVWYSQAGFSLWTLVALICAIAAYWLPFGSPR